MQDDEESIHSIFSNQNPASGGYGDQEETECAKPIKPKTTAAAKAKKKKKGRAAKLSRKKSRK